MDSFRLLPAWLKRGVVLSVCSGLAASVFTAAVAQLSVTFPTPRTVIQRNNINRTQLWVVGQCPAGTTQIDVSLTAITPGSGLDSPGFLLLDGSPENGHFRGQITAQGGWYHLNIRALRNGVVLESRRVTPIGIGEVFVVAGQSNGQGVLPNRNTVPATDSRVVSVHHYNATDTIRLPLPPVFEPITRDDVIGPRGLTSWCWGVLGDSLAKRLNVPVAFYNAAWSGTAVRNWRESIVADSTATSYGEYFRPKMPYGNLRRVLQDYAALTGLRAVLWHQGEAEYYDVDPLAPNYYNDLRFVIAQSRSDAHYPDLAWMVARASIDMYTRTLYPSQRYEPVWNAQTQVIQSTGQVFFGPDTDPLGIPRIDGVHLSGTGLVEVANAWNTAMNADFFSASMPLLPQPVSPLVDLTLSATVARRVVPVGGDVVATLTLKNEGVNPATGLQLRCQLPPNLLCVQAGPCVFRSGVLLCRLSEAINPNSSRTLSFVVRPRTNGTYQLAAEVIKSNELDDDSRPNTSFGDGQDDMTLFDFRTPDAGSALYTAPVSINAVVLPPVASNQPVPDPNKADLSLQLVSSALATGSGQPLTVSLVVTNRGGSAATNVTVECQLPTVFGFFNSTSMSLNGWKATGSLTSIPAGESAALWFSLSSLQAGMPLFRAQISAVSVADPDSTPNNGYDNGEDDSAQLSIRVH